MAQSQTFRISLKYSDKFKNSHRVSRPTQIIKDKFDRRERRKDIAQVGNSFLVSCTLFLSKRNAKGSVKKKMCNFFHKHTSMLCFLIVVDRILHYAFKESFYVYLYCLYRFGDLFYELPESDVFF